MLDAASPHQTSAEISCISSADPAFEDVLRLRDQATPVGACGSNFQDGYDEVANI